jgi:TonB family protein
MAERDNSDEDTLTLRLPRSSLAVLAALVVHVLLGLFAKNLPEPKRAPERIELALTQRPASPKPNGAPPPSAPEPPKKSKPRRERTAPPPPQSPAVPVLPPSENPPENRAQLPMAERSDEVVAQPEPAPPTAWKDRLFAQLASTRPKPAALPTGPLMPSVSTLDKVADADPRMHDEETEARMAQDFGLFMRRGLEALRANWHPQEVLDETERDPTKRCGKKDRMTFAVAVIDKQGNVLDVELKNPSGCPDLDVEAMAAFHRVANFPNPPSGLFIGPDGSELKTARYPVRFLVYFDGGLRLDWR